MSKPLDLRGLRVGRLAIIEFVGKGARRENLWSCRCDCGEVVAVAATSLKRGATRSCGCLFRETRRGKQSHGGHESRLYGIWKGMKARCRNPKRSAYQSYGARGITYCSEWEDFAAFRDWAEGAGYDDSLTLDRIDTEGNYEPQNCRWATRKQQSGNRRCNIYVDFQGERLCLTHAAEKAGLRPELVYRRVYEGWAPERALNLPRQA